MSRKGDRTRNEVLEAAWALFRENGPTRVSMAEVADRAGLTRQALYLHFPGRKHLLLALVDHMGRKLGKQELFRPPQGAATARAALDQTLKAVAQYAARIHDIAQALDLERHADADVAAAWNDRMLARRRGIRRIARRLAAEKLLRHDWSVERVVDAIAAICSPRVYADLVDRGWTLAEYERFLLTTANAFLRSE